MLVSGNIELRKEKTNKQVWASLFYKTYLTFLVFLYILKWYIILH
jgi:hypothetical protein